MKEMDKILRSKLYNHESALPDDLWSKIETGIEKKKKKGFIWFLFGGIGLLGILSATIYFSGFMDSDQMSNVPLTLSPVYVVEQSIPAEPQQVEKLGIIDKEEKELSIPIIDGTKKIRKDLVHQQISKPSIPEIKKVLISAQENEQHKILVEREENLKIDIPKITVSLPALINNNERSFGDPVGCPTFSKRNRANLFIEAYYQPLFAYSQLSSNSPEVGEQYLKLRKDSESNLYSWSTGINVGWISDYNVGVKAGAEYEVINERFTYEDPAAIRNQTVITIDTIFNGDGTFDLTSDTSVVQISGAEIQKIHNYHRTLSIPIHALYQMNFNNLAVELSGGPIFNIYYKNRGKIVDPSNQAQWFTNGESGSYNVYKDRLSVGFSLSVSALYSINEHIQLFARPTFKYTPGTMSVSSSPFNQTYMNTGLSLGARYYFSGNPNY
ncbi:hypothetical protein [Portibacter lacus]|uniref:Outer membrane protein beta-barrel domain-containing protein n=1 Tax=Portibacter lacus TaxID=1099794 RepID=A0AA37SR96_9BACT|nr:hypothetical protein [Portibacter lacus]GLR16340.1 hypothetical protein GCM10007940_09550 [Portibacter lacus]